MNLERVVYGFVMILALAFSHAFVMGDIDDPGHHSVWLLTIAILISLIATGLKLGDRSQVGALRLITKRIWMMKYYSAAPSKVKSCRRHP